MDCKESEILLSAYLDQELSKKETTRLEEHLVSCARCRESLEKLKTYKSLTDKVPAMKAPGNLLDQVVAGIEKEKNLKKRPSIKPLAWIPALAAAAVLAAVAFFVPSQFNTTRLNTDFAYQMKKSGKGPGSRAGRIADANKEITLVREAADQVGAVTTQLGYNEASGMTDYMTVRIGRKHYQEFLSLLVRENVEVNLPAAPANLSKYVAITFYFPGRLFASGDFNGDGRSDMLMYIIRGMNSGQWYLSLNDSVNRFLTPGLVQVGDTLFLLPEEASILSGDLNGDGYDDLVIYYRWGPDNGEWYIYPNNRNGSFLPGRKAEFTGAPIKVTDAHTPFTGDFNGDGLTDLGIHFRKGKKAGQWHIALDKGGDKFAGFQEFPVSGQVYEQGVKYSPLVLDYNGDGLTDCGIYWQQGDLCAYWYIALNRGDSSFGDQQKISFGHTDRALMGDYIPFTGDFNGDSYDDLIVKIGTLDESGPWHMILNNEGKNLYFIDNAVVVEDNDFTVPE